MVRFSCFTTHIPYHKSKKSVQQSVVEMHKELKLSQDQTPVLQSGFEISNPPHLQTGDKYIPGDSPDKITSPLSFDGCWKSEELNGNSYSEDTEGLRTISLKKSQSLGSGLDREGRISCGIDMEDETDRGLSVNDSHEMIHDRIFEAFDGTSPQELHNHKEMMEDHGVVHNECLFSIEDLNHSIEGSHQDFGAEQSVDHLVHSGDGTPRTPPAIAKSHSSPNFRAFPAIPDVGSPSHRSMVARSRSFDDLCTPHAKRVEHTSGDEGVCLGMTYHKLRDESFNEEIPPTPNLFGNFSLSRVVSIEDCLNLHRSCQSDEAANQEGVFGGEDRLENQLTDGCDSHNIDDSVNDWSVPRRNSIDTGKTVQQEPYVERFDELSRKNSNIRRIEEWISQIDFGNCSPVRECGECSSSVTKMKKESHLVTDAASAKLTAKVSPGMEGAYKYISSLTTVSTSAHMANLGLVAIPFLSMFVSLRELNLSGNSILRITSGALPRGLHTLNLSKNSISTIEGLRELTRLRVLDLSYNRIFRIGHGLASCCSLKELYLAGNKISEVEGLHRLLKLNVLDLRSNKISTTKCLGQLAANYGSLHAINLEGNPAQRNVGDEQLKKYLVSLLPKLVYYNKQIIRVGSSKEVVVDRAHQFDRGLKSEYKHARKGNASTAHKPVTSRGRHGRVLPPTGPKGNHLSGGSRLLNLREFNMPRSMSEGTLLS